MASTLTTFDGLLKERYLDSSIVEKLVYPDNPLLGMLEQKGDAGMVGDVLPIPIIYVLPQGVSSAYSTAATNATNLVNTKINITMGDYHGVVEIGDKVLEASRSNAGAFLEDKRLEIDGLYETGGESLSIYAWGNGGQAKGQVESVNGANTLITLSGKEQIANFEIGEVLVASANDGADSSHTLRSGSEPITGINRSAGTLTGADWSGISGIAAGDYLFRQGDFFGDQSVIVLRGVQSFVAATDAPPALWNITAATRALDPQRLGGCRLPASEYNGKTIDTRIRTLCAWMTGRFKAKRPTAGFMHPEDFTALETLMMAQGQRSASDGNTKFGYSKIDVNTAAGQLPIYVDRHCPKGHFFALRMEDWGLHWMGNGLFHPQNRDGFEMLRRDAATDYQFRLISYPGMSNRAMKNSGRVPLGTV